MELFRPSKKLIDIICSDESELDIYYSGINREGDFIDVGDNMENLRIKLGYRYKNNQNAKFNFGKLFYPYHEASKNCLAHGKFDIDKILVGHYIGDLGVCYGFYDGGNYFRDENIKNQYENRIPIMEFNLNPRIKCRGHGVDRIYKFSDFIEVDSKNGILYLGNFKEGLFADEN